MDFAKIRAHITSHVRFLEAGPVARDLWTWGMLHAAQQESDGELPMAAVLASAWGRGGKANVGVAARLVEVGLWERTETGYRILRFVEQGNLTKAKLEADRAAARERMNKRRTSRVGSGDVRANCARTNGEIPTSSSYSSSESRSEEPQQNEIASSSDASVPTWFEGSCDAAAMVLGGEVGDRPARWAEYKASRSRKTWDMNHTDAVGWLSTVVRSERSKASAAPKGRGAEITKQPCDPNAPWMQLSEVSGGR